MKRQLILGLILLVLVAAAFAAYFLVDRYVANKEQKAAEKAAELQIASFNSSAVTKLDLHTPELDYTVELTDAGDWAVTNEELNINSYYITALLTQGCDLTADKDLGIVGETEMESYGLTDPISITYYTDSGSVKIYVGNSSPTNEYFYMMKEGSDHVYLVDADVAGYLYVTKGQLRYRYVMEDTSAEITQVSLKHGDAFVYDLTLTDGEWEMTEPFDLPLTINYANLTSLFVDIQHLEADDFGEPEEEINRENAYTFRFTLESGEVTTLIFEEYDPLTVSMVKCLREETGDILIFESSYITFLQSKAEDLLLESLCEPAIEDVKELTFQYEGSYNDKTVSIDDTFAWNADEGTYSRNGKAFSSEEAIAAFQRFFLNATIICYDEIDLSQKLPAEEPALTLRYDCTDGSTRELTLYRKSATTYLACVDGEFVYALVRQRELSGDDMILEAYDALLDVLNSET